jgi:hypothetical protein
MRRIVGAVGLMEEPALEFVERLLDSIRQRNRDADGRVYRAGILLVELQAAGRVPLGMSPPPALLLAPLPEQTGLAA